jgi:hypothetical protein
MKAVINDVEHEFEDVQTLRRILIDTHCERFREVWVEYGDASMCALAAGETAWLMMLRCPGDSGFSSRNSEYNGPESKTLTFRLTNGQYDEYPEAWTLPCDQWVDALLYFAETGRRSDNVEWDG